ncbi:hypothetical protein D3C80_1574770 [compost metagenome]
MLEGRVRQACQSRQARRVRFGDAVDGDQVQVGDDGIGPVVGDTVDASFGFTAQMFQHTQATRPESALAQQFGNQGRGFAVVAENQQANAAEELRIKRRDWAGDHG